MQERIQFIKIRGRWIRFLINFGDKLIVGKNDRGNYADLDKI